MGEAFGNYIQFSSSHPFQRVFLLLYLSVRTYSILTALSPYPRRILTQLPVHFQAISPLRKSSHRSFKNKSSSYNSLQSTVHLIWSSLECDSHGTDSLHQVQFIISISIDCYANIFTTRLLRGKCSYVSVPFNCISDGHSSIRFVD